MTDMDDLSMDDETEEFIRDAIDELADILDFTRPRVSEDEAMLRLYSLGRKIFNVDDRNLSSIEQFDRIDGILYAHKKALDDLKDKQDLKKRSRKKMEYIEWLRQRKVRKKRPRNWGLFTFVVSCVL